MAIEALYYNKQSRSWAIQATGKKLTSTSYPAIGLAATLQHEIHVIELINDVVTPVNLATLGITAIQVSVDKDYTSSTTPLCRTNDPADYDLSQLASGIIIYTLSGKSAPFQAELDGKQRLKAYHQIKCFDSSGEIVLKITPNWKPGDWSIICEGDLDPDTGELPDLPENYRLAAAQDAIDASKFDKNISDYPLATLTGDSRIPIDQDGSAKKTTVDGLIAKMAASYYPPQTFSTAAHSAGVISYTAGILTLSGTVAVNEILQLSGVPIALLPNIVTYDFTADETIIDLAGGYADQQGTDTWIVRFSGGYNTHTENTTISYDIRQLLGTLYNGKYAYLTQDSDILIDGMISTPDSIQIKVKSNSETETGNAYCRVVDDEGGATAWTAIPVTLDWTTVTIDVSSLSPNTVLKIERDSDDVADTLGDPAVAMLIANKVGV